MLRSCVVVVVRVRCSTVSAPRTRSGTMGDCPVVHRYRSLSPKPSTALGPSGESPPQDLGQDDGVVMFAVVGGVHEGERAFSRPAPERSQLPTTPAQLIDIATAELVKPLRRVAEPLAQLRA